MYGRKMLFSVPAVAVVLMVVAARWDLVCGAGDAGGGGDGGGRCSPYLYPGDDDVDVKVAVILGMRNSVSGKCGSSYNIRALQVVVHVAVFINTCKLAYIFYIQ